MVFFAFFFQAEDGIRDYKVTGVQTCALPISPPAIQIELFFHKLGLAPSLHLGTLSALIAGGALLEYDAQTDHGNSGGPLFDAQTGAVYGIVTWGNTGVSGAVQNNIAISIRDLTQFFQNAHVQV